MLTSLYSRLTSIVLLALALCCALSISVVAAGPDIDLADPVNLTEANWPADVALGDIDNDGDLDMAVTDATISQVRIFHNVSGAFVYTTSLDAPVNGMPMSIVLAELNGDGKLDIASANRDANNVSIFLGDGNGQFSGPTNVAVGAYPQYLEYGDVDNDGDIDLIVSCKNSDRVDILTNDGFGTFTGPTSCDSGTSPEGIDVADLNNDGWLDIAVVTDESSTVDEVSVLWNDRLGGIGFRQAFSIGSNKLVNDVQAADLNNDGWLDLSFGAVLSEGVLVMLGDAIGGFGAAVEYSGTGQIQRVLPVDLNGDGNLDLVAPDASNAQLNVFAGAGDGTFGPPTTSAASMYPADLAAGDLDQDGKPDLAVCNHNGGSPVGVYMNTTAWQPADYSGDAVSYNTGASPVRVAVGDMNRDGLLDVVVARQAAGSVAVSLQQADGTFPEAPVLYSGFMSNMTDLALGDLNRNGFLDVVIADDSSGELYLMLNFGMGMLIPNSSTSTIFGARRVVLADLNGDAKLDAVVASPDASMIYYHLGDGAGGFGSGQMGPYGGALQVSDVAVTDLNLDGDLDVIAGGQYAGRIAVYLNDGSPAFSVGSEYDGATAESLAAGDLNGDGWPDAVMTVNGLGYVGTLPNTGAGAFDGPSFATVATGGDGAKSLALGDYDRDGALDIVTISYESDGQMAMLPNLGTGTFGAATTVQGGSNTSDVVLADMNNDGMLDVVSLSYGEAKFYILYGEPAAELSITKSVEPAAPFWGDAVTYTIQICNTGGVSCTGVLVTDTFPSEYVGGALPDTSGLVMTSTSAGPVWTWDVEDMAPGASGTITLTGYLDSFLESGTTFTNTAEINANETDVVSADAVANVGTGCVPVYTVTSDADSGPGTLRQAMAYVCDGGTIDFSLSYPATITLTSGELSRMGDLTIRGPGSSNLTISGNDSSRIINSLGAITVTGVTLRDGNASGFGGAILAQNNLTLSDTSLISNTTTHQGGALCTFGVSRITDSTFLGNTAATVGGAINAMGHVTVVGGRFEDNSAVQAGGALWADNVTITGTQFISNTQTSEDDATYAGGAVYALRSASVENALFERNDAAGYGGGMGTDCRGACVISVTNTTFLSNSAQIGAGAYAIDATLTNCTGNGNAATQDGGAIASNGMLQVIGGSYNDNAAGGMGGALYTWGGGRITDSTFLGNTAATGGGAISAVGPVTVVVGRFENNSAVESGGAVWALDVTITGTQFISNTQTSEDDATYAGGAVYAASSASVENALFERNTTPYNGGGIGTNYKGACTIAVSNTAFVSNTASVGAGAYAIDTTLTNCTGTGNVATQNGGAAAAEGALVAVGGSYTHNTAGGMGGALGAGSVTVTSVHFEDNTASTAGAVVAENSAVISDCVFVENSSTGTGLMDYGAGAAGGLFSLSITNSEFYTNTSAMAGGAAGTAGLARVLGSTFQGNTAADTGGALCISATGQLMLETSSFEDNQAGLEGGGVYAPNAATVMNCDFVGNTVTGTRNDGGALWLGGEAAVTGGTFQENHSNGRGGAIGIGGTCIISCTSILSNTASWGGGGLVSDGGVLTMYGSTVAYNVADDGDSAGTGGGIQLMDAPKAVLTNCTVAHNEARGGLDDGGAGMLVSDLTGANTAVHLTHCTIAYNETCSNGGGLIALGTGSPTFVITNTLIAGNIASGGTSPDVSGTIMSNQGNVVGDATGSTGLMNMMDQWGSALSPLDALTGALGNYGGETATVPLLPGSPAANVGTGVPNLFVDQRGVTRDPGPDSGAFESRGFYVSVASGDGQSTPAGSQFADPLVVRVATGYDEPVDGGKVFFQGPMSGASATFTPADPTTISGGQASVVATANDTVGGPYTVMARLPQARVMLASLETPSYATFSLTNTVSLTAEAAYAAGPAVVCPGHNIYYSVVVSNTSVTQAMEGLVVTGTVPATCAYYGEETAPAEGEYDSDAQVITWALPSVPAGEQAVVQWTVHNLSSTPSGTVITGTAGWSSDLLAGELMTSTVMVDDTGCTPPPPASLTIQGVVYVEDLVGPSRHGLKAQEPVAGATVTATTCVDGAWVATTNADGEYTIVMPGEAAEQCDEVTLTVTADGYDEAEGTWTVADIRAGRSCDFWLEPPTEWIAFLPLGFR